MWPKEGFFEKEMSGPDIKRNDVSSDQGVMSGEPTVKAAKSLFNEIETEVVFLSAVFEIVNSMVNHVMLRISGSDPDCQVVFASDEHRQLS